MKTLSFSVKLDTKYCKNTIFVGDRTYVNISFTKATKETTRRSAPASISHGIETTEGTTLKPSHSTMQASADNVKGDNHIKSLFEKYFRSKFKSYFFIVNKSAKQTPLKQLIGCNDYRRLGSVGLTD
jgi:hypothetical protein